MKIQDINKYSHAHEVAEEVIDALQKNINISNCPKTLDFFENEVNEQELHRSFNDGSSFSDSYNYIKSRDKKADVKNLMSDLHMINNVRLNRVRRLVITSLSAASILVLISFSIFYIIPNLGTYKISAHNSGANESLKTPTLMLDDGRMIALSDMKNHMDDLDAQIVADNKIAYRNSGQKGDSKINYNTLIVPSGYTYSVELSDGTTVTVNSGGELRYPLTFVGNTREVEIKGEAYFEVKKSKTPFIVKAGAASIQVYGTKFVVFNSKALARVETVLVEGSVGFKGANGKEIKLRPDQMVDYNTDKETSSVQNVNARDYTAWMKNQFKYVDVNICRVLNDVSEWYGIDFVMDKSICNIILTMEFDKANSVDWVISSLEILIGKNITKEGGGNYRIE